ncbi:MAG TPA: class I SAM-dependent methyltransferase [Phycisphaerae bacterium]|nr:class I SAM-dependent methyltransferase [Phycisphaerae bacterium]
MTEGVISTAAPEIVSTREGYDRWAEFYDGDDNPLVRLEEPVMAALLGDVSRLRVLDVGCGTGRWSARLASSGASVTAFDFSAGMLARARMKSPGVSFLVQDVRFDFPFRDHTFDRVACCLVLDHVANLEKLFREMGRVCRSDGFVAISVMHPAMMLKGTQARFRDPVTGQETRPRSESHEISDYVNAIQRSGLVLESMREYRADEALAEGCPRALKYLNWPMLLTIKLRP